jgi:hypothetical protein
VFTWLGWNSISVASLNMGLMDWMLCSTMADFSDVPARYANDAPGVSHTACPSNADNTAFTADAVYSQCLQSGVILYRQKEPRFFLAGGQMTLGLDSILTNAVKGWPNTQKESNRMWLFVAQPSQKTWQNQLCMKAVPITRHQHLLHQTKTRGLPHWGSDTDLAASQ